MSNVTTQREFVIPLENRPGTLGEITSALGKANVNIIGYLCESQGDFGVLRIITNDPTKTESWLKQSNRPYRSNEVVWTPISSKPGELGRLATSLSKSGINILSSYPTENGGIAFCVDNVPGARKVLSS